MWYYKVVGEERCTIVDTWWQTGTIIYLISQIDFNITATLETGGIMITPRPSSDDSTPKPGFPMTPFFSIEPVLMSDDVICYK